MIRKAILVVVTTLAVGTAVVWAVVLVTGHLCFSIETEYRVLLILVADDGAVEIAAFSRDPTEVGKSWSRPRLEMEVEISVYKHAWREARAARVIGAGRSFYWGSSAESVGR